MDSDALALGVDLGTGSARAFVLDGAGRRLGGARYPYTWSITVDGAMEADADPVVERVLAAMDTAVASLPNGAVVRAVGFSALWHTLLAVDDAGRPVTPVFAWSDTRAAGAAAELREELDEQRVHARTGAMLHPSYPPARLRWLRATEPGLFRRTHRWMALPEYLWLKLTGEHAVDVSMAAGSGLLDQARLDWDEQLLRAVGLTPGQLGTVVVGHEAASVPGSRVAMAERWPPLRDAIWRMPAGDGACANIGSGCHDRTRAALNWLERTLQLPADGAALHALLASRQPGAHGIAVLPFLAGERSPDWPLDAVATFAGVRVGHSSLDLLQAGLEAVAYRLALLRRRLRAAVPEAADLVVSGGAIQASPAWAQLLADALGEELVVTTDAETSSRGAALLALEAAGLIDLADASVPPSVRIGPDPGRHRLHSLALERHVRLEARMR